MNGLSAQLVLFRQALQNAAAAWERQVGQMLVRQRLGASDYIALDKAGAAQAQAEEREAPGAWALMSEVLERPVALLVSRSMAKAPPAGDRRVRMGTNGQGQYRTPEGQEVHAVADRSTGFMHRPHGTPVYLLSNWLLRDDQRIINEKLIIGALVQILLTRKE